MGQRPMSPFASTLPIAPLQISTAPPAWRSACRVAKRLHITTATPRPGKQGRRPYGLKFLAVCTRVKVASTECVTAEICAVTHSALYWAHHGSPPSAPAPQQADCFHQYKRNPTPQSADCLELPEPSTALGGCVRSTKTSTIPL